jgi:hypothetical protein
MANLDQKEINDIVEKLKKIEYGSLVITVHEGQVTQVDTTEKSRFDTKNRLKKTVKDKPF